MRINKYGTRAKVDSKANGEAHKASFIIANFKKF
jgi:hypothetical protein